MLSKCVFYRPEHRANCWTPEVEFWKSFECKDEINQTDRVQKVDEKKVFICLVIMFTSIAMVIKMLNKACFDPDKWPHFLSTIWTLSRAYSRK